jgi:hypothetical protein
MWSTFWNLIADFFQAIFSIMPAMGRGFNILLIIIGFLAFFIWLWYMSRQREVEKFD